MSTLTVYPEAGATPTNSVDGNAARSGVNETLATIIAGAGTTSSATAGTNLVTTNSSGTTNQFSQIYRSIFTFLTSSLGADANIISAVLSFKSNSKYNQSGGTLAINVVASMPAADNRVATADYGNLGTTVFASVAYADWKVDATYNDISLDANGIANIDKTGVSCFGVRTNWDVSGTYDGSGSNKTNSVNIFAADQGGTTSDPKLTIVYGISISASVGVMELTVSQPVIEVMIANVAAVATLGLELSQPDIVASIDVVAEVNTLGLTLEQPAITTTIAAAADVGVMGLTLAQPAITPIVDVVAAVNALGLTLSQPALTVSIGKTASVGVLALTLSQPTIGTTIANVVAVDVFVLTLTMPVIIAKAYRRNISATLPETVWSGEAKPEAVWSGETKTTTTWRPEADHWTP